VCFAIPGNEKGVRTQLDEDGVNPQGANGNVGGGGARKCPAELALLLEVLRVHHHQGEAWTCENEDRNLSFSLKINGIPGGSFGGSQVS
jgi:hypothetical protein